MKYIIGLLLIILLLSTGCSTGASSLKLSEPLEHSPILVMEYSYDWGWQEDDYQDGIQSFLARGDVHIIAIERSYRNKRSIETTVIFYQKEMR